MCRTNLANNATSSACLGCPLMVASEVLVGVQVVVQTKRKPHINVPLSIVVGGLAGWYSAAGSSSMVPSQGRSFCRSRNASLHPRSCRDGKDVGGFHGSVWEGILRTTSPQLEFYAKIHEGGTRAKGTNATRPSCVSTLETVGMYRKSRRALFRRCNVTQSTATRHMPNHPRARTVGPPQW